MRDRPYLNLGIGELEALFEKQGEDTVVLDQLLRELSHRSTRRAKRLESRAQRARQQFRKSARAKPRSSARSSARAAEAIPKQPRAARPSPRPTTSSSPHAETKAEPPVEPTPRPSAELWKPREKPPVTNSPAEILSAWISQEVLTPVTYRKVEDLIDRDPRRVCDFSKRVLPWEGGGERSRRNYRLYYHVVLGSIVMAKATKSLLDKYADTRPEPLKFKDRGAIAIVTVDNKGRPAEDNSVLISSFAWGLGVARSGDLRSLSAWPVKEPILKRGLEGHLLQRDDDSEVLPLTKERIDAGFQWLRATLDLTAGEVEAPR